MLDFIKNNDTYDGIPIQQNIVKKFNPKRLQRKVAKELQKTSIASKTEEALKAEFELSKKEKNATCKQLKEGWINHIRNIKVQKVNN